MKARFVTKRGQDLYPGVTIYGVRYTDPGLDEWLYKPLAFELRAAPDTGWRLVVLRHFYDGTPVAVAIERAAERVIDAADRLGRCSIPVSGAFLRQVPNAPAR